MSKNYTNYSRRDQEPKQVVEQATEEVIEKPEVTEPVVEEKKEFEAPVLEEMTPPPAKLKGVVTAKKLNVRKTPNANVQNIVATIPAGTVVTIETGSTNDFYEIATEAGVKGYCMKQYIEVK